MGAHADSIALVQVAAQAASDKLAEDIVALDVAERMGVTDAFLIVSGGSEPQVNAIADEVQAMVLGKFDLRPVRREGFGLGRWVLLDYGDVVVHIQRRLQDGVQGLVLEVQIRVQVLYLGEPGGGLRPGLGSPATGSPRLAAGCRRRAAAVPRQ